MKLQTTILQIIKCSDIALVVHQKKIFNSKKLVPPSLDFPKQLLHYLAPKAFVGLPQQLKELLASSFVGLPQQLIASLFS